MSDGRASWRGALAAAAALGVGGAAAVLLLVPAAETRRPAPPRDSGRIEVLRPTGATGAAIMGYGDAWVDERAGSRLLRVQAPEGRVIASVPLQGRSVLAAGANGVWALQAGRNGFGPYRGGPLLHVDPRTNRVRARIPLRAPSGERIFGAGVEVRGGSVWVWGPRDILRIDPRTDRVVQRLRVAADVHGNVVGLTTRGNRLLVATADGTFLRIDARKGVLMGAVRTALAPPAIRADLGDRLIVASRGVLTAVEPFTGKVAWTRRLGFRVGAVIRAHGLLWVHSAGLNEPGDRLSALDPATGTTLDTSVLPAFGTSGILAAGERLLLPVVDGRMLVVTPLLL